MRRFDHVDGDGFNNRLANLRHATRSQNLGNHIGKIVRVKPDGGAPADNPFVGRQGAKPEIWAYGVRNAQALAFHPRTGKLWEVEQIGRAHV